MTSARYYLIGLNYFIGTITATDLNFRCFNTVRWATTLRVYLYFFIKRFLLTNIFNASRKYKPRALQKRPLYPIFVSYMNAT